MITRRILLVTIFTLLWLYRLPAPIIEQEDKPAPEKSGAPKPKRATKPTEDSALAQTETRVKTSRASVSQGPARFAGTWSGKINQGLLGHVASSVTVNANGTSVELSHNLGGNTRPATISGNSLTWKSGVAGEITWTLIPNSDGQTAQITMKGLMLNDTSTFRRGQPQ